MSMRFPGFALTLAFLLASPAFGHGPVVESIARLDEKLAAAPGNAELRLARAELHRVHGDYARAQTDLAHAARLLPDDPRTEFYRGRLALDQDRFAPAVEAFTRSIARGGTRPAAHLLRAKALLRLGRAADAVADYDRALALRGTSTADVYAARARAQVAAGDVNAAVRGLDDAIGALGPVPSLIDAANRLDIGRGEVDRALRRLDVLMAASPRKDAWLERRGDLLVQAERGGEARTSYQAALRSIESLGTRRASAATREREGRIRRALRQLPGAEPR